MAQSRTLDELPKEEEVGPNDQLLLNKRVGNTYVISTTTVSEAFSKVPDETIVSVDQLVIRQSSAPDIPETSATAATPGTIWWDSDYVYIAVANNQVKRAALETF